MGLSACVCLFLPFQRLFRRQPAAGAPPVGVVHMPRSELGARRWDRAVAATRNGQEHRCRKAAAADFHAASDELAAPIDATAWCWTAASRELSVVLRDSSAPSRAPARVPLSLSLNVRS
jgi:hypothetical protein